MPKSQNQKLKLLYLKQIFEEKTDENNYITVNEIISQLNRLDISAERKAIYDDIEMLKTFGLDIISVKSKQTGYYLASREFELPELKILVDSVQSSKFITSRKSLELIKKISTLTSINEGKKLKRQVYVANRIKSMNESIYYNIDAVHSAISENKDIRFNCYEYTISKEKKLKKGGEKYLVFPQALVWRDENYYLIGYEYKSGINKHFRVDKMMSGIEILEKQACEIKKLDTSYLEEVFSMFGGTESIVSLEFSNNLIGVVIDRFGKDVSIFKNNEKAFQINVKVIVSSQFFGWLAGLGSGAKIISPQEIKNDYKNHIKKILTEHDL